MNPAEALLTKSARRTLYWGIASILTCCFPLSIVAVVLGIRTRRMARESGLVVPMVSTIGIVLGVLSMATSLALTTMFIRDEQKISERKALLKARIQEGNHEDMLPQATACDLAELRLLEDGFGGKSAIAIHDFECPGRLHQEGYVAEVPDITFRASQKRMTVTGCYEKGERWTIKQLRAHGKCSDPPEPEPDLD